MGRTIFVIRIFAMSKRSVSTKLKEELELFSVYYKQLQAICYLVLLCHVFLLASTFPVISDVHVFRKPSLCEYFNEVVRTLNQ